MVKILFYHVQVPIHAVHTNLLYKWEPEHGKNIVLSCSGSHLYSRLVCTAWMLYLVTIAYSRWAKLFSIWQIIYVLQSSGHIEKYFKILRIHRRFLMLWSKLLAFYDWILFVPLSIKFHVMLGTSILYTTLGKQYWAQLTHTWKFNVN